MKKPEEIIELEKKLKIEFTEVLNTIELTENNFNKLNARFLKNDEDIIGLSLNRCNIDNLSIFKNFHKLKYLRAIDCKIEKISNEKNIQNLYWLDLKNNYITKIDGFQDFKNLARLNLSGNDISKIENIESLSKLQELNLSNNEISKIEGLEHLINLENLFLTGNLIKTIEGLDNLKNLKKINLSNNHIVRIENINLNDKLEELYLDSNEIYKIENLDNLSGLNILELSSNNIIKIENLNNLTSLKKLYLDNNEISKIENFENIIKINELNLNYNKISKIENLDNLIFLKELNFEGNQISNIENLGKLKKLENLNLSNCSLKKIESLESLSSLKELFLEGNEISKIENLDNLLNLKDLNLMDNRITRIENLQKLTNLKELLLDYNQITKIENLDNLINLESLSLDENKILKVENLNSLIKLKSIYLSNNQISLFENLDKLSNLEDIFLIKNKLSSVNRIKLSKTIKKIALNKNNISDIRDILKKYVGTFNFTYEEDIIYTKDNGILLEGNPLGEDLESRLKIENLEDRRKSLFDYIENIKLGAAPFREAKLMLLGEGEAGKTNFSNYIMGLPFEKGKSATTGIKIDHWKPNINGDNYRFNIWDFGGQWIQQQVHQFFLTSECVYVIVLNARNEEKPHKWLDWIKNYASNSKTIIVANKIEENSNKFLEENNLKTEYPFIHSFHYVSLLKADEGDTREISNLDFLLDNIKNQLTSLRNIHVLHPVNYHKLKSDLEDNYFNKNHSLAFETFEQKLIQEHGIKGNSEILLKVLQIMGTVRYFQNYDKLILSPEWLSDGVYKIMMSKFANENYGVLNESEIVMIVKDCCNSQFIYKDSDINFLRQLMQDFELAYIDENRKYFIPTQFKTDIPDNFQLKELIETASLEFIFEFDTYFPEILISKLIVHFFSKVKDDIYWKTGVLLEDKDDDLNFSVSALIQSVEKERRIKIYMFGNDTRNFFKEIRNKILDYLKNTNYKFSQNVIDKSYKIELEYNELIVFYKNNINEIIKTNQGNVLKINVKETLGLINNNTELEALKKENEELRKKEKKIAGNTYTFNIDKVENFQAGENGKMIVNKNTFKQIVDKKDEIQSIIREIDKIKEKNKIQENINDIFIELLDELSKLNINDLESEPEKSKPILQKVYDTGKKLNDWKNITILPYEIIDKGSKIIESIQTILKPYVSD